MQDVVISAVSGYDYSKLKLWVNSLNSCGFEGKKMIVAFNISDSTVQSLIDNDIEVFLASKNRNASDDGYEYAPNFSFQVPLARHFFNWFTLKGEKDIRYVISTDCTDVIFQSNPSKWLEENFNKKLNYGCEGLLYEDEPWGDENFKQCFGPVLYDSIRKSPIYNAGSMAGIHSTFIDFSLNVFLSAQYIPVAMPDQAAVNMLLNLHPYKDSTQFNSHDTNWACQCGTTVDPTKIDSFRPKLLSSEPKFDFENGVALTSKGEKYVIVHQYNRVPSWKSKLEEKYG
jgi:hypothetical protein